MANSKSQRVNRKLGDNPNTKKKNRICSDKSNGRSEAENVADSDSPRFKEQRLRISTEKEYQASECGSFWELEPGVGRVVDGIPNRVDRIKGLGNAVVPQLVHNLFEIIKQVDNNV